MKNSVLAILIAGIVSACASAEKKECENRDWYEFGRSVALEGGSIENSPVVNQCRSFGVAVNDAKVATGFSAGRGEYCQIANFQKATEAGDSRSVLKCPENVRSALEQAQARGLKKHCTRNGAFVRGRSGKPNLNVCPENLRRSYVSYFSMGRVSYLKGEVLKLERRKIEIDRRNEAIAREIPEHESRKARFIYLSEKRDPSTTETLERMTMTNPIDALRDLGIEKERLTREADEIAIRAVDLRGEIQTLEIEMPLNQPGAGPLDSDS